MISKSAKISNLAKRRGICLPELPFINNYESKNTPPKILHNKNYFVFKDIAEVNLTNPPLKEIKRRPDIEFYYKNHLLNLKEKNITVDNHLIDKLFSNDEEFVLKINEYPYWFIDATHWVLWFNPNFKSDKDDYYHETTKKLVNNFFPKKNVIMFENRDKNKSVSKIKHIHVIIEN